MGHAVLSLGRISYLNHFDADRFCKKSGTRLPTKEEFEQLAAYMGRDTAYGYNPFLADGQTEVIPGLSGLWFWSSTIYDPIFENFTYDFDGYSGKIEYSIRENTHSFRCVGGR